MKAIIIYYSQSGNTGSVAKLIQESIGCDIAEIRTEKPYTGTYNDVVEQGEREVNAGYMPPILPLGVDLSAYDTVILGTPVWWYTVAPAVRTFLSQTDLAGKTVYPFATNGGWIGHTFTDIAKLCKGADVKGGLDIHFEGSHRETNKSKILKWASFE